MAKKKEEPQAEDAPEGQAPDGEAPKQGFVKKLLGNRKLLIIMAAGLLLVLGGGGAGLYFFVFSAPKDDTKLAANEAPMPVTPPQRSEEHTSELQSQFHLV